MGVFEMGTVLSEIEWYETYALGFPEIDRDHKALFEIINSMIRSLSSEGGEACENLSKDLVATLREHFPKEEKFLEEIGFTWLDQHASHHAKMLASAERLQESLVAAVEADSPDTLLAELIELILEDVRGTDLTFRTYLRDKGLNKEFDGLR